MVWSWRTLVAVGKTGFRRRMEMNYSDEEGLDFSRRRGNGKEETTSKTR